MSGRGMSGRRTRRRCVPLSVLSPERPCAPCLFAPVCVVEEKLTPLLPLFRFLPQAKVVVQVDETGSTEFLRWEADGMRRVKLLIKVQPLTGGLTRFVPSLLSPPPLPSSLVIFLLGVSRGFADASCGVGLDCRVGVRTRETEEKSEIIPTTSVYSHMLQTSMPPPLVKPSRTIPAELCFFVSSLDISPPLWRLHSPAGLALGSPNPNARLVPPTDPRPRCSLPQPLRVDLVKERLHRRFALAQAHAVGSVEELGYDDRLVQRDEVDYFEFGQLTRRRRVG